MHSLEDVSREDDFTLDRRLEGDRGRGIETDRS